MVRSHERVSCNRHGHFTDSASRLTISGRKQLATRYGFDKISLMLSLPDLTLELLAAVFVALAALIAFAVDYKWRDRRARRHRQLIWALLWVIVLASIIGGVTTFRGHIQEQALQQRMARIDEGVEVLLGLARERDPSLSEQEALNAVIEELRTLRNRTSGLELELQGLKRYANVAELNAFGLTGIVAPGSGLRETSALSMALDNAYERSVREGQIRFLPRCGSAGMAAFADAAALNPDFPFAHWALAVCAQLDGNPSWRTHAERAVTILRHTTQIAGHHPNHEEALNELMNLLSE